MVLIKFLDKGPYYNQKHERLRKQLKDVDGNPMFDEYGKPVLEKITEDWFLGYKPAYILTDESWLREICINMAKKYPKECEVIADNASSLYMSVNEKLIGKVLLHLGE